MTDHDQDSIAIAGVERLIQKASAAQAGLSGFSQQDVDRVCERMARLGFAEANRVATMAVEETGIGVVRDKVVKNEFATRTVWNHIKNLRTVGFISDDPVRRVSEIAVPLGVIAGLLPTTNPTSTAMFKALIAVKSRNAVVFSPHPRAARCSMEAARIMNAAAVEAGAPDGLVSCLETVTMEATDALIHHRPPAARQWCRQPTVPASRRSASGLAMCRLSLNVRQTCVRPWPIFWRARPSTTAPYARRSRPL